MKIFTYLFLFYQLCFGQDKGIKSYNDGDYITARNFYENILSKRKNDKKAKFGLGASMFKSDSLDMAGELFRSLINSDDKELSSKAAYNYANILKDNQKNKESLEYFKKAIKLNSKNKDAKINYELLKKFMNSQQDQSQQDQSQQDQSQQDQSQQDQSQQDQSQQDQSEQDQSQQDQSEQDQSEQDQSEQDQSERGKNKSSKIEDGDNQKLLKNDRKIQAEAILDALKNEERINQLRQIKSAKSKTLEKDW